MEGDIRNAAATQQVDLAVPENANLVSKKKPGGWTLWGRPHLESALHEGIKLVSQGNIDVYILDSQRVGFSLIAVLRREQFVRCASLEPRTTDKSRA